jgi:hypothetical protein
MVNYLRMPEYSIYENNVSHVFSNSNPRSKITIGKGNEKENEKEKKNNNDVGKRNKIRFEVRLIRRNVRIVLYKDDSLEDLYIKIYNAVYPDFSTEKNGDTIPPANTSRRYKTIPYIYHVSVLNDKCEIVPVPIHKFITITSFMKTKPSFFKNTAFFGIPTFKIYALDEECMAEIQNEINAKNTLNKNPVNYLRRIINCIGLNVHN